MLNKIKRKLYTNKLLRKEKKFEINNIVLKYIFLKNKRSDDLVIMFSGFPGENRKASYNYMNVLKESACNQLFILDDFGSDRRGSYYLGSDGNLEIADATSNLIKKIIEENNIKKVISAGSSKGAFAALYFGFRNNFNSIIIAEPQIMLGNYLSIEKHVHILKFICGDNSTNSIQRLNDLLINEIKNSSASPKVYINYGSGSSYYNEHIIFLEKILKEKKIDYISRADLYSNHQDLVNFYPDFLVNSVSLEIK